jgi:hypothetical protein
MKRILLAAAAVMISFAGGAAEAQMRPDVSATFKPIVLANVPDVAQCRGILKQEILDLVNNAAEDPAQTFEKNRRAHPHMIMMPAPIDCASKLWQALNRNAHLLNFAKVPTGTEALSLRQDRVAPDFDLRALAASVGNNIDPNGGVEGYQGENAISIDPNNPQHMIAHSNTFFRDANCVSPTGGAANTYGTMALFGSTDGGGTWTYNCAPWPAAITGGVPSAIAWFGSDPALAWDSQGRAYACYMLISEDASGNAGASIVVARSANNGTSWQSLGTVVNRISNTTNLDDKQMFAIDNSTGQAHSFPGRLYVIWDEGNAERVAHSDDGVTWTTVALPSNTAAIGGNVVVGADGTVYVIWTRYNVETIVFSKSTDGGATWTTPAVIATIALQSFGSNNTPPAQDQRGINGFGSIDVDRNAASPFFGNLYVAFPDFPTGTTTGPDLNTYVVTSTNGGTSWSTRTKVNDDTFGATQFFPWLAVDQSDGTVNVSWYDTRLDPFNRKTQAFYARSSNGGVSFEPNILVMDGGVNWRNNVNYADENSTDNTAYNGNQYGDYSGIAALNRQVHPLWTDSRMFFPAADTQSPTRREDNATAAIVNCSAPSAIAAPNVNPTTAPSVVVSWSAPAGWGTNATSGTYSVYRNTSAVFPGGAPLASNLTSTTYVDTTGILSTTYFYFVRARNNCPGTTLTPMTTDSPASAGVVFGASGTAVGTLQGTITSAGNPVSGATVTAGTFSATTNASGFYQFAAINAGTYSVSASATGYTTNSASGVVVSGGATTVQDLSLTPLTPSACLTDTTFADFSTGSGTNVDIAISPNDVKLAHGGGEQLDLSVTDTSNSGNAMSNTTWWGQTFTPTISGTLTKLDVELFCSACSGTTSSMVVNVHATSGGLPTGAALATTTIPAFSSGAGVYYAATFGSPATLTAGTVYAFTVHASSAISAGTYAVVRTTNNLYGGGQNVVSSNSGSTWGTPTGASKDLEFHTYITTPLTYPNPGTFTSAVKDSGAVTGTTPTWTTLSWTATVPANTTVKFQAAGSSSAAGPFTFVGPDGTAATFFTTSGASLSQFNGKRYLQYKAFLSTTDTNVTPTLSDVTLCYQIVDCSSVVPTITPSPSQVCASSTGNTASGPGAMTSYAWTIANGTITVGASSQTVTYTAGASGSVGLTLTVTTSNGCQAAGSASVPILSTPAATNGGPYCVGATIALFTPAVSGATYSWSGPNGFTSSLQNPTRAGATLADAGTYSVTVTVGSCTTAAGTTSVVVNSIPATPTASNGGPYCAGGTIALSTPLVSGATYSWTGPNGFTSSLQNPTRSNATTADAGTYSVTITVSGCTSAAGTTSVTVNPIPATPTASNGGPYCAGATIALSTPLVSGATYAWTGPNGFTSSLQNPTRTNATLADAGTYSVTVAVSGCTSAAGTTSVVVNPIPATPTASNGGPYCEGATIVLFTPVVSGATYAWSGPNGFTSALQNPTRSNATFADAGTYSVTVTVNGCTSAAGTTSVVVNPIPATPTASNGGPYCEGTTIALATPVVSGATYAWSGPNGFTSSLQNPTRSGATLADAGTYFVTVTVNGCTSAAGSTSVVVNATPATPTASNGGPYCEGATIALSTPLVSGATYAWTGPNGFTSSLQNPTRTNATTADAGTYSVTVAVNGCTSAAGTTSVVVNPIPATPTASNGGPYCEGATIALSTPLVSGATYSWSGPNGFTSSQQNPTRPSAALADAGTYSVTITVNGCTSAAGDTAVIVNPAPATPTASNGGPYCAGATIALSTPLVSGATYAWTGPNGFTSTDQNPTRANATTADAGTYSVTVTVDGCPSAAGTTSVVVNAIPATPTASNGGPYCEGGTIALSTPLVSGATYAWSGPNGFTSSLQNPTRSSATLADAGTYSVTVTVNGCTSAAGTTSVVVNAIPATPTASNGGPYCEGATIALSTPLVSGATYAWSGPNGFTSSLQNPTRSNATTADAGTYFVTVTVNGCTSAAGSTSVVVNATPATPAASNGGPYCEGATISLSTPLVSGATYAWTGPNGFTSSLQNPTRSGATLADAGTYSVTVAVNGCPSGAGTTSVVVNPIPATPTASNGGPYCEGATIALSTPLVSGATYAWSGPNGFTSSQQNPTRPSAALADAGTYSVTITVNGCTSAAGNTTVIVNPAPSTPTASNGGPYCEGATISLSTPLVSGATYSWTGPNGFTSSQQNPTRANATTADAGTYSVTVTVDGCPSAAGTTSVVVNPIPATPTVSNGGPYCEGATIVLSTPLVSGATYAWSGPNGFTSSLQNPTRSSATLADAGTYSVTVTVNGCTSAAGTTSVVVNAIPATPTASNGGPYCEGATIALSTPLVSGATYAWSGPNGFASSLQNPTRSGATTADAGTYFVTVTVNGCTSAAGSTSVIVNPTPATPTASNGGPYCEGATIALSTPLVSGATYSWTGPNGFTSSLQNPTRTNATLADAGTYSVTVTVNGCPSAAGTTSVIVNAIPATPTASNGGLYCEGATIALSTPTVTGATYSWTGPNGFTSSQQNPTRASATLADAGTYSVTVTVNGCTSAAGTTSVVVNATPSTPTANNGGPYCEGATIALSTPLVSGATYSWTGPNGFTSSLQNPTRASATLADAGTYSVTVTVNGCPSAAGTTSVVVNAIPTTPTASNGGPYCVGAAIALSTPLVSGATYSWSGPNGFTSSLQNPTRSSATLADAGTYSVTVTVNGCTSAAGTTSVVVSSVPATPAASNGGPYCEGATIALSTALVSGATYSWTGPNGFTSSQQNPTRPSATVADAGTYSVTITVNGCTSAAGNTTVIVNPAPATPTASNGGPYCEGATISLSTPLVSGATYAWTGPNGFTSTDQNPTRTNATTADAGTYSVTVTVDGCPSAAGTTDVVVSAIPATPTASNGGPYCEGATIALSTPAVTGATYSWSGPNGFTSSLQNPTRASAALADAGTYSVTITVNGCTSAAGSTSVVVNATPATPTASNIGPYCAGATIALSTPLVSGATYSWTGPNGFTSSLQNPTRSNATTADAGTYSVTITVNGCTSAAGTTNVIVNAIPATPTASNGGPYCAGGTIALSTPTVTGATYSWTGPNGFTSSLQNPTRSNATVADAGTYSVTITVNGCPSAAGTTSVVVNAIPATPTASNGGPYCAGGTIALSTPTVSGATYSWTGPNGFASSLQNPTRSSATTADAGTYSVTVTVNGCTSAAGTTSVVVNASPATPTASNNGPTCEGGTISLSTPTVTGATYAWSGPNGFSSTQQNPTRPNAAAADFGIYSVTVTVNGCTSAAGTTTAVDGTPATPTATAGGPYCEGMTIALFTPTVAGATYAWSGPNGFTSSQQNPTKSNVTVADAGTYSVTVTVSGCTSAPGTVSVNINPTPATPAPANGGPYCVGSTISLSTATVAGATYFWAGPNGFTSFQQNPAIPNATAANGGTYDLTVSVNGCPSQIGHTTVNVNPLPNATISVASTMVTGATGTATVADAGTGATYAWSITNGTINGGNGTRTLSFTAGAAGTLTLNVTVTAGASCSDTKSANVTVTAPSSVTVTGVVPPVGRAAGGTNVTISGSGFQSGATVTFGGAAATNVVVVSATSITATTPAHAVGTVNVAVTNPDSSSGTANGAFTYVARQFDPNNDGVIDPSDIFYLVNYLFTGGPAPQGPAGMLSGDANGDGGVDPSDIFYVVNYLFTNGPQPMSGPIGALAATAAPPPSGAAALSLGRATLRVGRWVVPVIVTPAAGGATPEAFAMKIVLDGDVDGVSVHRAGVAANVAPSFEVARRSGGDMAYLVVFGGAERLALSGGAPAVIAEVEVGGAGVRLDFDRDVTLAGDAAGTWKATVANGKLTLSGTAIAPAPRKPQHDN